ncbi:MAG: pyridoxal phosphate-dependent aminotransferase [Candidatus Omnitrophica bacterium]|nr:pyridoxal phosphate-dependent aminotransferase [Candidatus Omnitrophota bacterium]
MKAEGIDIIGFGAGEPDFDTPEHIKAAAKSALDEGFTKYTPASGIKELKEEISRKFKDDNGLRYSDEEIIVSCGAKHALFNAILVLCDEKDEVIVPSPYWVSYPEMIKASGAKVAFLKTSAERNFKVTATQLKKAIKKNTKLFILNSPSNPTGMVYREDELADIAKALEDTGTFCLSDEIYEKIIYDNNKHTSIASLGEDIRNRTIVINGVSKSYSMTGWRIGYAAGPSEIIRAMGNLQSHSTSNPTSFAQKAAVAALSGRQEAVGLMVQEFKKRRDYITGRINKIKGISCLMPQGAFYIFVNISAVVGKRYQGKAINGSFALTQALLEEARVAVVPGSIFGDDNYLRISYATSMDNITSGIDRIEEFINKL